MDLSGPKKHKSYNNGPEALRDRIHPENHISYWIFAVSNRKIQVKSPNGFFEHFRRNFYNVNHLQNLAGPLDDLKIWKDN